MVKFNSKDQDARWLLAVKEEEKSQDQTHKQHREDKLEDCRKKKHKKKQHDPAAAR